MDFLNSPLLVKSSETHDNLDGKLWGCRRLTRFEGGDNSGVANFRQRNVTAGIARIRVHLKIQIVFSNDVFSRSNKANVTKRF